MKIVRPIIYNWEAQIEEKIRQNENTSISEMTNDILDIIEDVIEYMSDNLEESNQKIKNLDKKIDKLNDRITDIEGDVKINRKLIDAMRFAKKD